MSAPTCQMPAAGAEAVRIATAEEALAGVLLKPPPSSAFPGGHGSDAAVAVLAVVVEPGSAVLPLVSAIFRPDAQ